MKLNLTMAIGRTNLKMSKKLTLNEIRTFLLDVKDKKITPTIKKVNVDANEVTFLADGWEITIQYDEQTKWSYIDSISDKNGKSAEFYDWHVNSEHAKSEYPESSFDEKTMEEIDQVFKSSK